MPRVRLVTDPLDLSVFTEHEVPALIPFLQEQFPEWPPTARLYRDAIAVANDVTPMCEADIERLTDDGDYYVVVYPGDPVTLLIIAVVVFVVATVAMLMLMPKMAGQTGDQGTESSTNSLGNRVNKARPNGRIPDIFGRVRAIPELLTVPLLMFEDNLEFELCYMAVGRGEYLLDPDLVFDGQTPLDNIAGAGAKFYDPFTRPGLGAPSLEVGEDFTNPLYDVIKLNEVNGQKLKPPNANQITGKENIKFVGPDEIVATGSIDFTENFEAGDDLIITGAGFGGVAVFDATTQVCRFYPDRRIEFLTFNPTTLYTAGQLLIIQNGTYTGLTGAGAVVNIDVSGTYEIVSVSSTQIQLA